MNIEFTLNGKPVSVNVPPHKRLVDILREEQKLQKTRSFCYRGECGGCAVLVNFQLAQSCLLPAFKVRDTEVITLEGFEKTKDYQDIVQGFAAGSYYPCDQCSGSRILAAHTLLETNSRPTLEEVADYMSFITCTCSDFTSLYRGIQEAARLREERSRGR